MLSASHRLRKDADIKTLFAKGKGVFDSVCGLKYRPNSLPETRFAVVVGTTVSKRAVVRNQIRRRLREVIRARLPGLKPGFDAVLIVRKDAIGKSQEALARIVDGVLRRSPLVGKSV